MEIDPNKTGPRLGVVGAGNMGSGIAQKMATEGFDVVLVDLDDAKVRRGLATVRQTLDEAVGRRLIGEADVESILGRIHGTTRFDDLAAADLVVEAVFEDLSVKHEVFRQMDRICDPHTVLATNTSSYLVAEIASATQRPERVVGLHYFYHPAKNRLVEVIAGIRSDPAMVARARALQELLGKTPIASADAYGFIVNRFFVPWLNEATRLTEEGIADPATVDAAAKRAFGIGMGPFELMNVTGVPIALHAATVLGRGCGAMYAPTALLARQVQAGQLWDLSGEPDVTRFGAVEERLLAVVFSAASALVEEGVGRIEEVEVGARVGLRWEKGPFELMNERGVGSADELTTTFNRRWSAPASVLLSRQAASGTAFAFQLVRANTSGGIRTITIDRPDALNALNETVIGQLRSAFEQAARDPDVRGIVIAGAGKAFVAGADIKFFIQNIQAGDLDRTMRFTKEGQELLATIEASTKPVVARVHGLALGGGVELALACHYIVATPKASFAFPETGIGIYPALGGTQRTTRRLGIGLTKWLVLTGHMLRAADALAIGLVDRLVPLERLDQAVADAISAGPVHERHPATVPDAFAVLAEFFERHQPNEITSGDAGFVEDERVGKAIRQLRSKAPIALRMAAALIERGARLPLDQGLRQELSYLVEIFSTKDALEGLTKVGRNPIFHGS